MIVIDVGCAERGPEESVNVLIDRFHPELLLGFDPDPELEEGCERINGSLVVRRRACVWNSTGSAPVEYDGICTGIDERRGERTLVDTIDIRALLRSLPSGVVLKLDCEGAEQEILTAIHEDGYDEQLGLILVEWHPRDLRTDHGRGWTRNRIRSFTSKLRCPVEEWG